MFIGQSKIYMPKGQIENYFYNMKSKKLVTGSFFKHDIILYFLNLAQLKSYKTNPL